MFNGTPVLRKDKARWVISNLAETKKQEARCQPSGTFADMPRRAGERLFMSSDEEAYWRGWEITPLHGGLGRSYRDPRFDALHRATGQHRTGKHGSERDGEQ